MFRTADEWRSDEAFCAAAEELPEKAAPLATAYLMAALVFAKNGTSKCSRCPKTVVLKRINDLEAVKKQEIVDFVEKTANNFVSGNSWKEGMTCQGFYSAMLEQMDKLRVEVAKIGLFVPLYDTYATPEEVSKSMQSRLKQSVDGAIHYLEESVASELPFKIADCQRVDCLVGLVRSFADSIKTDVLIGGATANATFEQVLDFVRPIVRINVHSYVYQIHTY